jgi:hypothetical protein
LVTAVLRPFLRYAAHCRRVCSRHADKRERQLLGSFGPVMEFDGDKRPKAHQQSRKEEVQPIQRVQAFRMW